MAAAVNVDIMNSFMPRHILQTWYVTVLVVCATLLCCMPLSATETLVKEKEREKADIVDETIGQQTHYVLHGGPDGPDPIVFTIDLPASIPFVFTELLQDTRSNVSFDITSLSSVAQIPLYLIYCSLKIAH